ncbi:hypothetical protein MTO96_007066 [Rhipicephalus appendiculatus]
MAATAPTATKFKASASSSSGVPWLNKFREKKTARRNTSISERKRHRLPNGLRITVDRIFTFSFQPGSAVRAFKFCARPAADVYATVPYWDTPQDMETATEGTGYNAEELIFSS